jgi:hypothetical protein
MERVTHVVLRLVTLGQEVEGDLTFVPSRNTHPTTPVALRAPYLPSRDRAVIDFITLETEFDRQPNRLTASGREQLRLSHAILSSPTYLLIVDTRRS